MGTSNVKPCLRLRTSETGTISTACICGRDGLAAWILEWDSLRHDGSEGVEEAEEDREQVIRFSSIFGPLNLLCVLDIMIILKKYPSAICIMYSRVHVTEYVLLLKG